MIRRLILTLVTLLSLQGAALVPRAMAAEYDPFGQACSGVTNNDSPVCRGPAQHPENNSIYGPNGILTKIARFIAYVVGIVSVFMIIFGGLRYILAQGDATKLATAKNTILYSLVGLVIAAFAQIIVSFALKRL